MTDHADARTDGCPPVADRSGYLSREETPITRAYDGNPLRGFYAGPLHLCGLVNPLAPLTYGGLWLPVSLGGA